MASQRSSCWIGGVGYWPCVLGIVFSVCVAARAADRELSVEGVSMRERGLDGVPVGVILIDDYYIPAGVARATYMPSTWTNGIIPYQWDANVSAADRQSMIVSMNNWEAIANLDFRPRNGEANFVHIEESTTGRNRADAGMQGGEQSVEIGAGNFGVVELVMHELGHTLSFKHEQSRTDRKGFVDINDDAVRDDRRGNFEIEPASNHFGPYDFGSIMHYPECAFSCCRPDFNDPPCICTTCTSCSGADLDVCRTIIVKDEYAAEWQSVIGSATWPSYWDQLTMQLLYPEDDWVFVDMNYSGTQLGTFMSPYVEFASGEANTPVGGTLWVQGGTYGTVGVYPAAITMRAPYRNVVLR